MDVRSRVFATPAQPADEAECTKQHRVGLMYGKPRALECNPDGLLVPASLKSVVIPGPAKLCEEADESDGSYELEWMNTTELPVVFDLPSGVTETDTDYRVNPLIQGVLQRHNYPNGSVISPDRSLKLKFAASAVTTGTQVKGETDWRAWSRAEWPAVYGTRTPNSP